MIAARVAGRARVARDILQLDLVAADGGELPAFTAGAHIDLILPDGLTRQYSLCNDPRDRTTYRIAVLREAASRGGSAQVHDLLVDGAQLTISEPRNLFGLDETAARHRLFAGGVGITPILAMAWRLHALDKAFTLDFSARDPQRAAFLDVLDRAPFATCVRRHFDVDPATLLDLDDALTDPQVGDRLYVCGPAGYMAHVIDGALARGWAPGQIRREHFAAAAPEAAADRPFDLVIAATGQVVGVAAGQTAAEALEAAGCLVLLSCGEGVCGTCLTPVVAGEVDHRDVFQTAAEKAANTHFTPCCSRARHDRLVIAL